MPAPIAVAHYSDPGCPWAYSAWPAIATLMWRYGDQLDWSLATIGLSETPERYLKIGYTPARQAKGYLGYRRYGMPFGTTPRPRVAATGLACRVVVATRLQAPDRELAVFRALQFAHFCTPGLFDTQDGVRAALDGVAGIDAEAIVAAAASPETEAAYQADRATVRTAEGSPTSFQDRAANTDGTERYTAPSLIFTRTSDGRTLEAGGFQPVEAYDVLIANLDPTLTRRAPAGDPVDALQAFENGLTSMEVAAIMAPHLVAPDRGAAESLLIDAAGEGRAQRRPLGDDALWTAA